MQNEPNFQKSQMNVNPYNTKAYENKRNWTLGENEPNTNPIKANTNPIRTQLNPIRTQNKPNFRKAKMKLNFYSTKDYENKPRLQTPGKQTQLVAA